MFEIQIQKPGGKWYPLGVTCDGAMEASIWCVDAEYSYPGCLIDWVKVEA